MFRRIIGSGLIAGAVGVEGSDMEFITSAEVTGSNATSLGVSGLSLAGYSRFLVLLDIANGSAGGIKIALQVNGDTTSSNYWQQRLFLSGTTVNASRVASNEIIDVTGNRDAQIAILMGIGQGDHATGRVFGARSDHDDSSLDTYDRHFSVGSKTNITSLDFVSDTAGGLGVGTKLYVYGIKDS